MTEDTPVAPSSKSESRREPHWAWGLIVLLAFGVVVLNWNRIVPAIAPPAAQVSGLGADPGGLLSPFRVWGSVRNVGGDGRLALEATVTQGDGSVIVKTKELSLKAGEVAAFEFEFENVSTLFGEVSYSVRGKK